MHNRKAQIAEGAIFWIFYILLTSAVVFFVVYTPVEVLGERTKTNNLENAIFAERAYAKTAWQSPLTNRAYLGYLPTKTSWNKDRVEKSFSTIGTPRKLGLKLTLNHDEAFVDENFYKEAKPLSPVRYPAFVDVRPVWIADQQQFVPLVIDQVYTPRQLGGFV